MNNHESTRMDTNLERLLFRNEVFQILSCAIEVLKTLSHGLFEKPYEKPLLVEFLLRRVGVILNFKKPETRIERILL